MWVTQTYLGCPDPGAKLFVYYLWEDYRGQQDVPEEIIQRLKSAGSAFGKAVSLFAPISGAQDEIRAELRYQGSDFFWRKFNQKTPCLLLTTKPLVDLDPHRDDEYRVLPLPTELTGYEETIEEVFRTLHEVCTWRLQEQGDCDDTSFLEQVLKAVQIRPSIFGIGIDLKPILSWVLRKIKARQSMSTWEQGRENVLTHLNQALEAQHTKVAPFDVSEITRRVNCARREAETLARDLMAANDASYDHADRLLSQVTVCRDALLKLEGGQAAEQQLKERIRALLDELNSDRS